MAFTVEYGTGLTNSNAYVSVADADAYFADRGNTTWAALSTAAKQGAIVRATQAVDSNSFRGTKASSTQALAWPRTDAYSDDGFAFLLVPVPVKYATYEGALVEAGTAGALTPTLNRGGRVIEERVEGAITVKYSEGAPSGTTYLSYVKALQPVLRGGAGFATVGRG